MAPTSMTGKGKSNQEAKGNTKHDAPATMLRYRNGVLSGASGVGFPPNVSQKVQLWSPKSRELLSARFGRTPAWIFE